MANQQDHQRKFNEQVFLPDQKYWKHNPNVKWSIHNNQEWMSKRQEGGNPNVEGMPPVEVIEGDQVW